jgi:hypothetical protein
MPLLSPSLSPCATVAPRNIQRCNYLGGPFTFCIEIAWEMESESIFFRGLFVFYKYYRSPFGKLRATSTALVELQLGIVGP